MTDLRVFEVRGVYVFRWEGDAPPSLARHYNGAENRYEVPTRDLLAALPTGWELVEEPDAFRVRFHGDLPGDLADEAVLTADGPRGTTALFPDEETVERALDAGGQPVD